MVQTLSYSLYTKNLLGMFGVSNMKAEFFNKTGKEFFFIRVSIGM